VPDHNPAVLCRLSIPPDRNPALLFSPSLPPDGEDPVSRSRRTTVRRSWSAQARCPRFRQTGCVLGGVLPPRRRPSSSDVARSPAVLPPLSLPPDPNPTVLFAIGALLSPAQCGLSHPAGDRIENARQGQIAWRAAMAWLVLPGRLRMRVVARRIVQGLYHRWAESARKAVGWGGL
jgi:hypothetical protein